MTGRLINRRILVTGAASGIGKATAELFRREGARVAFMDRDEKVRIAADSCGAMAVTCDVTDEDDVHRAVSAATDALGGLDGLVNAAGIASTAKLADTTRQHWDQVLAVNLTGPFLVCRAALAPLSAAEGATIVNVASASALLPSGAGAAYAASKAGLLLLTKSLAIEWAPKIRVNAVCPGTVDTPMVENLFVKDEAFLAKIKATYALQRLAEPEEIARSILFLTSADSSFVTGVSLAVDGGRSFH